MIAPIHLSARFTELLAGEAAGDLTAHELSEIEALKAGLPATRRDDFIRVAALAQLAFLSADAGAARKMPAGLEARLMTRAAAYNGAQHAGAGPGRVSDQANARRRRQDAVPWRGLTLNRAGWYIAVALAAGFAWVMLAPRFGQDRVPISEQRATLLHAAADVLQLQWGPSDQPGYAGARGDVVWSSARQQGYLRLAGLPINDPEKAQYQLWIIDPERDANPVDGGVFDISTTGEVLVPIQAKLAVIRPTAFAITLEKPGGVVVSTQPLLVVAAVGG